VQRYFLGLVVISFLTGCEKQTGEAVVLSKEHIAAAPPISETPSSEHAASPKQSATNDERVRSIEGDEVTVDGYVMKPEMRGTSSDPRALKEEQWLVKVQMVHDERTFNVPTQQTLFDKLKVGDRVGVNYHLGKYTKTVWGAQISE
jgi:hypothetical protein